MKHWKYAGLLLCALTAISIAGCKKEKAQGRPESFKNTTLPPLSELSKYIAMQPAVPTPFWRFTVRAHQFGEHDYPDVRAGFPFRSEEMFAVARSGYFMLEKRFE